MTRGEVLQAILAALDRLNEMREPEERLDLAEETPLYGREGQLDSLSLVALVLDVEDAVDDKAGRRVVLADERALAQSRSPFRSVGTFADYVLVRLEDT